MKVLDCEKAAICVALRYPETDDDIVSQMLLAVSEDKFEQTGHKLIWSAINEVCQENKLSTIDNIIFALTKHNGLEAAGGEIYLRSLYNFLSDMGINTHKNWNNYVDIIQIAGSLRQFGLLIDEYQNEYKDFDKLVATTDNPEEYIFSFTQKLEKLFDTNLEVEGYKDIGVAVEEELEILEDIQGGKIDVLITGMPTLEKFAIPYPRSFGVIIGLRSMGKTQLGLTMALGKARHLKQSGLQGEVTINSLETPGNLLVRRLACCEAGIDSRKLRLGELTHDEMVRYKSQLMNIRELPISYDDNPTLTTDQLTQRAIAKHIRKKRVLGVSDYAELFNDQQYKGNEEQRIAKIVKNIRKIAWATDSSEILISQVNSAVKLSKSKIAGIDNARYSGVFAHAADWAVEMWNPIQMKESKIPFQCPDDMNDQYAWAIIEKNKNGPLGKIPYRWQNTYTRLVDIGINMNPNDVHKIFDFRNAVEIEKEVFESDFY